MDIERRVGANGIAEETRLGFENQQEASFALGVIGTVTELCVQEDGSYLIPNGLWVREPLHLSKETMDTLKSDVLLRRIAINVPTAIDHKDPKLSDEQSANLKHMIEWVASNDLIEQVLKDKINAVHASTSEGAKSLITKIYQGQNIAYKTALDLMKSQGGLFNRKPKLEPGVSFKRVPVGDTPSIVVTVKT